MPEPHRLVVRVYYEDTDFSGVVYHANYLRFFERGRTEWLRDLGVSQVELRDPADTSLAFAVRRMTIDYRRPARMDDLLCVVTRVAACNGASLDLEQVIQRGTEILTEAQVQIVLVGDGRVRRFPPGLLGVLSRWAGDSSHDHTATRSRPLS